MTPEQLEEARRLLRLARRDRSTFDLLFPLAQAELSALGFHAQQATEKALKAVAVSLGVAALRTHDLAAIGAAISATGTPLPLTLDELRSLNPFAVQYRYDDELIPATSRETLAAVMNTVVDWAEWKLSS